MWWLAPFRQKLALSRLPDTEKTGFTERQTVGRRTTKAHATVLALLAQTNNAKSFSPNSVSFILGSLLFAIGVSRSTVVFPHWTVSVGKIRS